MTTLTPAEANRLFYAEHAIDYDATEFCANAALGQQRLRQALAPALGALPPDPRVLDAGGGSGNASRYLFEQGLQPVLVDVSAEMVALWRSKASALGYEPQTQVAELEEFFAEDQRSWDLVVFSSVLHHLEDPGRVLGQVARRLAPGGFIVTIFDPLQLPRRGAILRKLDYLGWLILHARGELPRVVAQRLRPGDSSGRRGQRRGDRRISRRHRARRSRPRRGACRRGPPGDHAPAHLRLPLLAHPSPGARDADADRVLSRGSGSGRTAGKREGIARLRPGMAPSKRALITGISGQDGSYLAEFLLGKGYEVHGIVRRSSSFNTARIDHLYRDPHEEGVRMFTHYGDLADPVALTRLVYELQPDEIYHLGAQSHVRVSFDIPEYTFEVTGVGTLRLLEAIREAGVRPRFYQAASSEMFGAEPPPQSENTRFHPRSPYGVAKVAAYWAAVNYREAYEMFAVNGVLFNHESPRRGETFVTRKITRAVAHIQAGLQKKLYLGNLDAKRDWGYAPDFVEAMWLMLQADEPADYVVATGEAHSVRDFLELAFHRVGLDWADYVEIDPRYFRPAEVDVLLGDATKARDELGWRAKVRFEELVQIMVDADIAALEDQLAGKVTRYSHEMT